MHDHQRVAIQPDESRHNFYNAIHKGLRLGHCRLLSALGSHDFAAGKDTDKLLAELRNFLALGKGHLDGENREIHTALEARLPGSSDHAAAGHDHHEESFAELEQLIAAVERATAGDKAKAGRALYHRYVLFAADDFTHMNEEETDLLAALHKAFSDDELREIEHRIVAAIPPEKMGRYLSYMLPAMNHGERVAMVGGMQQAMPAQGFEGVFANAVRPALEADDFARLASAIGVRKAA